LVLACVSAAAATLRAAEGGSPPPQPQIEPIAAPKDLGELRAIEERVKQVVGRVLPATVAVQVGPAQGSGVIVSHDGLVMTAGHVVHQPGQRVTFFFPDGKTAKGTTLGVNSFSDAGLMKITDKGDWPCVERGRSTEVKPGSWCVTVGHPLGYQSDRPPVVRVGRVLRCEATVLQTDCPIVSGDSGGPVFDLEGKVIGINSRIGSSTELNLHVPVDMFTRDWEKLLKGEVAQARLPYRDAEPIKALLRPIAAEAARSVVRIDCDGKEAVLGTVVGPDGWVLTKASELKGKIVCRLSDQRQLEARLVGVHAGLDVAMLKIEAAGLPVVPWLSRDPAVGQWVVSPGPDEKPLALGVVGVPRRAVPPAGGKLGAMLSDGPGGALVDGLIPQAPAEKAGLKVKDVITQVNGQAVHNRREAVAALRLHRPGETVKLTVQHEGQSREFSVTLVKLDTPGTRIRDMQNEMGVGVSRRADGFAAVLQHDAVLKPADCGGPVADLSGKVIGINIARGGRTETYCLPTDVLLGLMYDLMSGRLAPPAPAPAAKPEQAKPPEKKPEEKKPPETKPPDKKPEDKKPPETKPPEKKPEEKKPPETKPPEKKPEDKKPPESKPPEQKPMEKKPEQKPAQEKTPQKK
jgi:serine protease Do